MVLRTGYISIPNAHLAHARGQPQQTFPARSETVGTYPEQDHLFEDDESLRQREVAQRLRRVSGSDGAAAQRTIAVVQQYSTPQRGVEALAMTTLKALKRRCMSDRGVDLVELDGELKKQNFTVEIKETKHNDGTRPISKGCLEQLRHTYIMCTGYCGKNLQHEVIIEPEFRSHFSIGQEEENPVYKTVLDAIPDEFVGSYSRLQTVVEAMSNAMTYAFRTQGMPPPPWRKLRSTMSKWKSPESSPASSPRAVASCPTRRSTGFSVSPIGAGALHDGQQALWTPFAVAPMGDAPEARSCSAPAPATLGGAPVISALTRSIRERSKNQCAQSSGSLKRALSPEHSSAVASRVPRLS
eukprot:jgi/Botrbrau1/4604/Bobra.60_2s0089.1